MKTKSLWILWGALYALCTLLGFIPNPTSFLRVLTLTFALVFFIPGGILVYDALRQKKRSVLKAVRILSSCSLLLTLVVLVANFLGVLASDAVGSLLYVLLVLVSTPMVCSGFWVVSLFLWACLLMSTFLKPKKFINPC